MSCPLRNSPGESLTLQGCPSRDNAYGCTPTQITSWVCTLSLHNGSVTVMIAHMPTTFIGLGQTRYLQSGTSSSHWALTSYPSPCPHPPPQPLPHSMHCLSPQHPASHQLHQLPTSPLKSQAHPSNLQPLLTVGKRRLRSKTSSLTLHCHLYLRARS